MANQKDDQLQQQHQPHGSKTEQDQDYAVPIFSPKSLPRRGRIKYCGIAIALVLLQIVVIGLLALTVFRLKDPNMKLTAVTLDNFNTVLGNPTTINMTLREEIKVTNRNWGRLKYDETILVLSHENLQVGQGIISRGSIKMRHSKIVTVFLEAKIDGGLNSSSSSSEISSGVLNLKSSVMLSGKVNVVGVVRKRRGAEMNCSLTVSLTRQAIQEFHCK